MVIVKCHVCSKEHHKSPSKIEKNIRNFCSTDCCKEFQKENPTRPRQRVWVNCDFCGKSYWIHKNRAGTTKHNFCSHKCKGKHQSEYYVGAKHPNWKRVEVFCGKCGKVFFITPYRLANGRGRFCSSACMYAWNSRRMSRARVGVNNPNWQGGLSYELYPQEFNDELKQAIRMRDNYTCQICGSLESEIGTLHIHHIDKNKKNSAPTNLVSLCVHCHISSHRRREGGGLLVLEAGGSTGDLQLRVPKV